MRQIDEVRKAYLDGCRTSIEVSKRTGLPRSYCSAYTLNLYRTGFLIRLGVEPNKSANGQCIYRYEPARSYQNGVHSPNSVDPETLEKIIELFLAGADQQINVDELRRAVAGMREDVGRLRSSVRRLHARRPTPESIEEQSMSVQPDLSKMKISELIAFAEQQAKIEQENPPDDDPDRQASWADTLEALRYMKARGVPEQLKD